MNRPSAHDVRVDRCVMLAGAMPDPAAHRRYLERLNDAQLEDRMARLAEAPHPRNLTSHISEKNPQQ